MKGSRYLYKLHDGKSDDERRKVTVRLIQMPLIGDW